MEKSENCSQLLRPHASKAQTLRDPSSPRGTCTCTIEWTDAASLELWRWYKLCTLSVIVYRVQYNNVAGYNFLHSHSSNAAAALLYVSYIDLPQVLRRCPRVWALAATCAWELCSKFEKSVWWHLQKDTYCARNTLLQKEKKHCALLILKEKKKNAWARCLF